MPASSIAHGPFYFLQQKGFPPADLEATGSQGLDMIVMMLSSIPGVVILHRWCRHLWLRAITERGNESRDSSRYVPVTAGLGRIGRLKGPQTQKSSGWTPAF